MTSAAHQALDSMSQAAHAAGQSDHIVGQAGRSQARRLDPGTEGFDPQVKRFTLQVKRLDPGAGRLDPWVKPFVPRVKRLTRGSEGSDGRSDRSPVSTCRERFL